VELWDEKKEKEKGQTQFKFTRSDTREKIEILTDHAQLNFYISCWTFNKISSTSIEPVVLALNIFYNK
jgi:hypothetical protein